MARKRNFHYKEILKEHFRQLDIWIVSNEVRII